jgi:hypothetical protein
MLVLVVCLGCGDYIDTGESSGASGDAAEADDAALSDTGPADIQEESDEGDASTEDVAAEVGENSDASTAEEVEPSDAAADTVTGADVEEVVEALPLPPAIPEGAMFRVNWVNVLQPGFCMKLPADPEGDCVDVSGVINSYLGSHLKEGLNPMDIVGFFDPFDFDPAIGVEMSFGRGTCKRVDDEIQWCEFWKEPTFFEFTNMEPPGKCSSFSDGSACYSTTKADMALDLAGVPLGFEEAFTSGTFVLDDAEAPTGISYAYVQGFMTQETAENTEIDVDFWEDPVPLSELIDWDNLEEKDGVNGWYFKVEYAAVTVPMKP